MSSFLQSATHGPESNFFYPEESCHESTVPVPKLRATRTRVLQISDDLSLANSRRLILRRVGFLVDIKSRREFWAAMEEFDYDAIVLCQTVSPGEAYAIAMALRDDKKAPPIVRFSNREELLAEAFHCLLQAPAPPEALCLAVSSAMVSC